MSLYLSKGDLIAMGVIVECIELLDIMPASGFGSVLMLGPSALIENSLLGGLCANSYIGHSLSLKRNAFSDAPYLLSGMDANWSAALKEELVIIGKES